MGAGEEIDLHLLIGRSSPQKGAAGLVAVLVAVSVAKLAGRPPEALGGVAGGGPDGSVGNGPGGNTGGGPNGRTVQ